MPLGMNLKSEPYGSSISSPRVGYDIATYCQRHNLDYVARVGPLTLERFLGYADWYTEHLVPSVLDLTVTEVSAIDGGYLATFADGSQVTVRQVVVATGVLPYAYVPPELSGLPSGLVSHSSEHHFLDRFQGRRVAVIGAGQSALESAALLHEAGVDVQVIARGEVGWHGDGVPEVSLWGRIRHPVTNLCEGWRCVFWDSPAAFRRLPQNTRITKARTVLGPKGAGWLRDRVVGVIDLRTNHQVQEAMPHGSGVRLLVAGEKRSTIDVDHVIAGTGFRIDTARLSFLSERLRAEIATLSGYPVVSRTGESTVPGLYFVGAPTAVSLGPSMRFIAGTHNVAAKLAQALARRAGSAPSRVAGSEVYAAAD